MNLPFAARLAWREGRSTARRLAVYMVSITMGVAALVAVHSFEADVARTIDREARTLLGADLRLSSTRSIPEPVTVLVDSLVGAEGGEASRVTTLLSMVLAPRSGVTRLAQLRAVEGGYPFYARVESDPAGAWSEVSKGERAVVDPAVLAQLDARIGDTLSVGLTRVVIAGTVRNLPTDVGFQTAIGPRVFVSSELLRRSGLLTFGSLALRQVFVRLPEDGAGRFLEEHRDFLDEHGVSGMSARDQAEDLTNGLEVLSRFLGLVGLTALLLGGVGVASAIHVFVKKKVPSVAVLRCVGATQSSLLVAYLLQAGALGLVGSGAGVVAGVAVQALLPTLVSGLLPVDVSPSPHVLPIVTGLAIGVWVAVVFALIPLLAIRDVAPLRALRQDFETPRARVDGARAAVLGLLAASVVGLSLWQAPTYLLGLAFAGGLGVTLGMLWIAAWLLVRGTRRFFPARASYAVRQGVANLFRPRNQTVAVTLALGFAAFLLGTVVLVERNLRRELTFGVGEDRANLLLFDIQSDQREGVAALLRERVGGAREMTPIVPARIAALNGRITEELIADSTRDRPERWAVRREYRNTYRNETTGTEEILEGTWWRAAGDEESPELGASLPRISLEADIAEDLGVGVGDRITWDVQGRLIATQVANLRRVDWNRFEPNFFVVFEEGVLDDAPQSFVTLAYAPDEVVRAEVQRDLVHAFPNVSVLDLALVRETVESIVARVVQTVRFLAAFAVAGGLLVLSGALATSRFQRLRETALLKTLGARRGQIARVLLAEYLALGVLAAIAGLLLAWLSAWLLVRFFFDLDFVGGPFPMFVVAAAVVALTVGIGIVNSRGVMRRPPLAVLRDLAD